MMKPDEIIKYKGYEIEIHQDDDPESPNNWGDDERFVVFDHRQFYVERKGFDPQIIFEDNEKCKGYHVFRCYAYIHSGVALSVGSHSFPDGQWDVSFKGFWLIKRMRGTWTRSQAYKAAKGFCETWNKYLSGDVWGYKSEAGSCWNFYGDEGKEQMIAEAKSEIDWMIEKKIKQHVEKIKAYIRNKVPLEKREQLCVT